MDGGAGVDTLDYSYVTSTSTPISMTLNGSSPVVVSVALGDIDTIRNFEYVIGTSGADTITGDVNANSISGGTGSDVISTGDGADTVSGGTGSDTLDGGAGSDLLDYTNASSAITINFSTQTTFSVGPGDNDSFTNFEGLIGGSGADCLVGDSNNNWFIGNAGADTLVGNAGADTLSGGAGNDRLDGGTNASDIDIADYGYATVGVSLTLDASGGGVANVGTGDVDTLLNMEGVIGGSAADSLAGNSGANFLSGGLGTDTLFGGGGGADTLFGGGGNDLILFNRTDFTGMQIDGGSETDTIQFQQSGSFTGAELSVAITNVEVLDFRTTGVDVTVALSGAEIARMAGLNGSNQRDLTLLTSQAGGDSISISDATANVVSVSNGPTTTDYTIYDRDATDTVNRQVLAILHVTQG
jgi:Ca2+-binding RTX toxin-like protein